MRQHPLIVGLRDRLGGRMEVTDSENETPQDGRFKAVFTATGFSLRLSSIIVDKRRPPREFKERPAPRRSRYGTFNRRKSNQL